MYEHRYRIGEQIWDVLIIPILGTNGYLFSYEPAIIAVHNNKGEIFKYSGGYFIEENIEKGFLKLEKMLN